MATGNKSKFYALILIHVHVDYYNAHLFSNEISRVLQLINKLISIISRTDM